MSHEFRVLPPPPSDAQYLDRLSERFRTKDARSYDVWLGDALDSLLYPICAQTAQSALQMTPQEVEKARTEFVPRDGVQSEAMRITNLLNGEKASRRIEMEVYPYTGGEYFNGPLTLPVWTRDASITYDLARAAGILIGNIPVAEARDLAARHQMIAFNDLTRGVQEMASPRLVDRPRHAAIDSSVAEGVFAIAQSVNMVLGQFRKDSSMGSEDLVVKAFQDNVPVQMARHLPWAELGFTNINGSYTKDLIVIKDSKFVINSALISRMTEVKAVRRAHVRRMEPAFHNFHNYLETSAMDITHSTTRGMPCPVSVGGENSGIGVLSEAMLHIFKTLRQNKLDVIESTK